MLLPSLANTTNDLQQILELQQENLLQHIDETEMKTQGFVTLHHDLKTLEQMHQLAPSVIIKENEKVIAYALTMLKECRQLIPDLEPMFSILDKLNWQNEPLTDQSYYVMGQICIARQYRGQGLFEELYHHHKKIYQTQFGLLLTEISTRNHRSFRAHERVGFKTIHVHQDELDEWAIVGWDWS